MIREIFYLDGDRVNVQEGEKVMACFFDNKTFNEYINAKNFLKDTIKYPVDARRLIKSVPDGWRKSVNRIIKEFNTEKIIGMSGYDYPYIQVSITLRLYENEIKIVTKQDYVSNDVYDEYS